MLASFNFHIGKDENLSIRAKNVIHGAVLIIKSDGGYNGVTIFATPEQLWDALKDLDLSMIKPKNMLEVPENLCEECGGEQIESQHKAMTGDNGHNFSPITEASYG